MNLFTKTTVYEGSAALHFSDGKLVEVLGPGVYRYFFGNHRVFPVNLLPTEDVIGGQEITSRDGGSVRISLIVSKQIFDAELYYRSGATGFADGELYLQRFADSRHTTLHHVAQVAVREWIMSRKITEVLEQTTTLTADVLPEVSRAAEQVGVRVLSVELLEFNITGGLKAAYNDLLKTEIEGQAALARAKNESTTMRSLLNTARLVREHPSLLELRVLSSGQKPRVTFVINNPASAEGPSTPENLESTD